MELRDLRGQTVLEMFFRRKYIPKQCLIDRYAIEQFNYRSRGVNAGDHGAQELFENIS